MLDHLVYPLSFDPADAALGLGRAELSPCFVTGAAGFLGRALLEALLRRGCTVHALDVSPLPLAHPRLRVWQADIRDMNVVQEAMRGCRTVFHTAARLCFLGICRPALRREVYDINFGGTLNVLRACRRLGVSALVHTSSNSVCFQLEPLARGDETQPYARGRLDIYGETKIAAEEAVLNGHGVPALALRPGGLWGSGPVGLALERILRELALGRFVARLGDGRALTDFTHVDNLVYAELLAAESLLRSPDVRGEALFVTDEEPLNTADWMRPLVEALGEKVPRLWLPTGLLYRLAHVAEAVHRLGGPRPLLTRLEVHNAAITFTFRSDRARRTLGYRPLVGREEGFDRCLPFCRDLLDRYRSEARG